MNHPSTVATESPTDLKPVGQRLRAILEPYRARLVVTTDDPSSLTLELPDHQGTPWGFAAGVRLGKRYVSFYLMGVYGDPSLASEISPDLRRRMQGKSCFNFTRIDEPLFAELEALTARSIEAQPAIVDAALARQRRPRR